MALTPHCHCTASAHQEDPGKVAWHRCLVSALAGGLELSASCMALQKPAPDVVTKKSQILNVQLRNVAVDSSCIDMAGAWCHSATGSGALGRGLSGRNREA